VARLLLCTRRRRESLFCAGPSGAEVATQDTASTDEESSDVIARKVFVSGLPLGTSEEDLLIAFSGCGKVGSDDCAAADDVVVVWRQLWWSWWWLLSLSLVAFALTYVGTVACALQVNKVQLLIGRNARLANILNHVELPEDALKVGAAAAVLVFSPCCACASARVTVTVSAAVQRSRDGSTSSSDVDDLDRVDSDEELLEAMRIEEMRESARKVKANRQFLTRRHKMLHRSRPLLSGPWHRVRPRSLPLLPAH
jgi:hypothetical protein